MLHKKADYLYQKDIIASHCGRISPENNANGKGATFSFSLPIDAIQIPNTIF
jgi:signal transduction histidine kinase